MKKYLLMPLLLTVFAVMKAQSVHTPDLSGTWKVTWNEGGHGPMSLEGYLQSDPLRDPPRFIDLPVPMELHLALKKAGLGEDINYGMNTVKARWVAEKYWLYVRTFSVTEDAVKQKSWLVFDPVDLNSVIFLNGEMIGTHNSAFVPCRIEVTGKLKPGDNILKVGVESGLYGVADKKGIAYLDDMGALLNKRHRLRKPQYQLVRDWNPQLINVGITCACRQNVPDAKCPDRSDLNCHLVNSKNCR